jgi:hypothetical protein
VYVCLINEKAVLLRRAGLATFKIEPAPTFLCLVTRTKKVLMSSRNMRSAKNSGTARAGISP